MKGFHVNIRHSLIGAVVALGLALTAQTASAGSLGQDAPALKEQAQGSFTLIKGPHFHHYHGGRFWWGVPIVVAPYAYEGSCYANCRAYRGPRYCHAYCGY
jgi:hypothetical protein